MRIKIHREYGHLFRRCSCSAAIWRKFSPISCRMRATRSATRGIFLSPPIAAATIPVEISVRDDGPGIPPDKIEHIFEAYYTTKEKGSGLGLAIVKHNAELYSGTVRAESELGKGAKFTLIFPAKALMKLSK